jgi:hypothetical protein
MRRFLPVRIRTNLLLLPVEGVFARLHILSAAETKKQLMDVPMHPDAALRAA